MVARAAREVRRIVVAKEDGWHWIVTPSTEVLQGLVPKDSRNHGNQRDLTAESVTTSAVESVAH